MNGIKLKLNPDKTEFIVIGYKHTRESLFQTLLCHSFKALFHRERRGHIHKFLTVDTAVLVIKTIVISRLDYYYSLLYGVSRTSVAKLQTGQNKSCDTLSRKSLLDSYFILYLL